MQNYFVQNMWAYIICFNKETVPKSYRQADGGTPARSCTLPAEKRCPQPLGKRLLLLFCDTPIC